jgi:hypothetical protein
MNNNVPSYNIPMELFTEDTADTFDTTIETRISLVVHEAVSTLLNESLLNYITFEMDNLNGVPNGNPLEATSYVDGLNTPMLAQKFMAAFKQRAWNSISNNNNTLVSVLVMGMAESETTVIITIDGRSPITYRYPTFADSKFLPIIMDNAKLDLISEDYNNLIDATLGVVGNNLKQAYGQTPHAMPFNGNY